MIAAAERGELAVVRKLFADGARIDARDQRGRTALLAATQRNRVEVARFLIQEGADVNAKDFIQDTPFLYAGAEGRIEILKMTLAAGANLKDINRYGGTALIPGRASRPRRGGEDPARHRDRQGSRQQSRLDRAARGRDPRRRRGGAYRDRPAAGRGRRQRQHRRPRRRHAARPCAPRPLFARWSGSCRPPARARAPPRVNRAVDKAGAPGWRCRNRRLESFSIHFHVAELRPRDFIPTQKEGTCHAPLGSGACCHRCCDRTGCRAIRGGRARRLSRQHHHDLRQLPFAEGAAGRRSRARTTRADFASTSRRSTSPRRTSRPTRRPASATGPTPRSRPRSSPASGRTACRSPRSCRRRSIRS